MKKNMQIGVNIRKKDGLKIAVKNKSPFCDIFIAIYKKT